MNAPTLRVGDLVAIVLDRRTCNSIHEQLQEQRRRVSKDPDNLDLEALPGHDDEYQVLLELEYAFLLCANSQAPDTLPRSPVDDSGFDRWEAGQQPGERGRKE